MAADFAFINEIEGAVANGSGDRRGEMLRRVTDLFIVGAGRFSEAEVALFDDVIARLTVDIEISARALLAVRLAPIPNAPPRMIRALAFDDAIDVAGPVLSHSDRLDELALVENASSKGAEHLLAISRRRSLSEKVTDVLIERGDRQVVLSTAENRGARFSDLGMSRMVERAEGDDRLAACVGARPELSPALFARLVAKASQAVRMKLIAEHPGHGREVDHAVNEAAGRIQAAATAAKPDYTLAQRIVESLHKSGKLDDERIRSFAKSGRFEETTAALAIRCELPIAFVERAMLQERSETLLVMARAIGLSWSTVKAILLTRTGKRFAAGSDIAQCLASFERLRPATAVEILAFHQTRIRTGTSRTP
jgi:uncharacterized protein (DUF2336 family)